MTKHECKLCNYQTKNKSDLTKHFKTKKHLDNAAVISESSIPPIQLPYTSHTITNSTNKSQLQCDYCKRIFTRYDNLGRHIKTCESKSRLSEDNKLQKQIDKLNNELELAKTKAEHYKHVEKEAEYYKQLLMEAGGLVKKSVNALTYSITNYNNAPHINEIAIDDIETFNHPTKAIVEDILSTYKHKTLSEYLGNLILKLYKKANPLDQSIWNTDDNRLTYIIKELLNDKSSNWIVDKKGVKTMQYLIHPLLEHIKKLIIVYQKNYNIPRMNQNVVEIEVMLENSKKIVEVINGIDDGIIAKDVLKYISCHLRFVDSSLKIK